MHVQEITQSTIEAAGARSEAAQMVLRDRQGRGQKPRRWPSSGRGVARSLQEEPSQGGPRLEPRRQ